MISGAGLSFLILGEISDIRTVFCACCRPTTEQAVLCCWALSTANGLQHRSCTLLGSRGLEQQQNGADSMCQASILACSRLYRACVCSLSLLLSSQAVQGLSGTDSQEQDLFASLSMCLAAVGAPQQQLQQLRCVAIAEECQAGLLPLYDSLHP